MRLREDYKYYKWLQVTKSHWEQGTRDYKWLRVTKSHYRWTREDQWLISYNCCHDFWCLFNESSIALCIIINSLIYYSLLKLLPKTVIKVLYQIVDPKLFSKSDRLTDVFPGLTIKNRFKIYDINEPHNSCWICVCRQSSQLNNVNFQVCFL